MLPGLVTLLAGAGGGGAVISGVEAVHFDGATYATSPGTIDGLPSSATNGLLSFCVRLAPLFFTPPVMLFQVGTDPNDAHMLWVTLSQSSGIIGSTLSLSGAFVGLTNLTDNCFCAIDSAAPDDGNFHTIIYAWDAATLAFHAAVDGVAAASRTGLNGSNTINVNYASKLLQIGRSTLSSLSYDPLVGDLADFYFLAGATADITNPSVLSGLIRPNGEPVRNGMSGTTALGEDVQPHVFLHGDSHIFVNNYKDGGWDTLGNYTDPGSNAFTVVGTLTDAATDPWGGEASGR